ncbi:DUF3566 domain-containing protein [Mycobacterium sp.]|uniref:DUF3566 domain-containing protein n=1 Tax=Mycobacterium sp. TaxID=1785 RepID=UPI003F978CD8
MTSPNEPGYPGPGDSPNGNGSVDRGGTQRTPHGSGTERVSDAADAPRPRGGARSSQSPPRPSSDAPKPREPQPTGRTSGGTNAEARLNRFISGIAAPGAAKTPSHDESRSSEAYASELPDLSGPIPRVGQRKPAADQAPDTSTSPVRAQRRIQVAARPQGPVRASMQIRRIDPWSTLKVSLVLSVALFFVWMIAVAFLYLVLGGMGVWSKLNSNVGDLLNNTSGSTADLVSAGTIFGGAVLIGLVNIVLLSAMATIGAFIYNLTTDLIGGVEVTLADRD